jgi:arylsulfatase A-like enzyme/Flp pilus assembly protein TadD
MDCGKSLRLNLRNIGRAATSAFCLLIMLALASCKSSKPDKFAASPQSSATQQAAMQPAESKPGKVEPINIVLITIDTLRADHLHCYGNKIIQTPNIDSLAKNGVLFERAVTQAPLTQPSHASIFTGKNPNVHGVRDTGGFVLRPSSVTMATILHNQGWDTAGFIGSTVLKSSFGFNQGFAIYDDQMPRSNKEAGYARAASRPAKVVVDHAIAWLKTRSTQPFFVWLHFYDPHEPYNPPEQFRRKYPGDLYDGEIAFTDQQLGRFLDAVKKKSPVDKTMIVVLADHGEGLGQHGEYNHGIFLYDSTIRIPWIMAGPGVPAGVRVEQQAREIDVLPTILALLGEKPSNAIQGTSMVPAFSGKPVPAIYSYEETLFPKINLGWSPLRGVHTAHWMYVRAPKPELYDLDQDPGELKNVIGAHPREYRELDAQLKKLSDIGGAGSETVAGSQMDQQTVEQLRSLGYVGGTAANNVHLNGEGADPKDRIDILTIMQAVSGPGSDKLPLAHRTELLRQAISQDSTNPALYYELAGLYMGSSQYNAALQVYLAALHRGIRDDVLLTKLGYLYLRGGDRKQAISYFEQAAQLNPLDVKAQSNLGTVYLQSGRLADAEHAFRRALISEQNAAAYNGLGIIAMQRNDMIGARRNYERAIQLNPDFAEAQFNLGLICKQAGDLSCARDAFRSFLADVPAGSFETAASQAKAELLSMRR